MNLSKYIVFIFLTLFTAVMPLSADDSVTAIMLRCEKARSTSDYKSLRDNSRLLISKSATAGNRHTLGYGYCYHGLSQLFTGKGKESLVLLDKAWEISREVENDTIGALVMNARGIYQALNENNRFLAQNYFFQSLDLAAKARDEKMKVRVYGNLLVLSEKRNTSQALTYARHVYKYGVDNNDNEQKSIGAYYLANYYYSCGQYDEALKYIDLTLSSYNAEPYDDVAAVYALHSKIMQKRGRFDEAMSLANKALEHAEREQQASLLPETYLQCGHVARSQGRYAESNVMAMKALEVSKEFSQTNNEIECYQLIADNNMSLGNHAGAAEYLQLANTSMMRQYSIDMERLMQERNIMDTMKEKERQAEMHRQRVEAQRTYTVLLSIVVAVLAVALVIIILNYRSRMKMVKTIVARNVRQSERIKYLSGRLESIENQGHEEPDRAQGTLLDDDARVGILYDRICDMMQNRKIYKEPQLTRERLAAMLGTNRTYLSQVIKEKSGMGYQQFVNSYRIEEATHILSDINQMDYPLKQIWGDLGFSSASTFYKLFIQQLGITPSVYRRQFSEISGEMPADDEEESKPESQDV